MQRTSPLGLQNNVGRPMSQTGPLCCCSKPVDGVSNGADAIGVLDSKFEGLSVAPIQGRE